MGIKHFSGPDQHMQIWIRVRTLPQDKSDVHSDRSGVKIHETVVRNDQQRRARPGHTQDCEEYPDPGLAGTRPEAQLIRQS